MSYKKQKKPRKVKKSFISFLKIEAEMEVSKRPNFYN